MRMVVSFQSLVFLNGQRFSSYFHHTLTGLSPPLCRPLKPPPPSVNISHGGLLHLYLDALVGLEVLLISCGGDIYCAAL